MTPLYNRRNSHLDSVIFRPSYFSNKMLITKACNKTILWQNDTFEVHWSYSLEDPIDSEDLSTFFPERSGVRSLHFFGSSHQHKPRSSTLQWTLQSNSLKIWNQHTIYWCTMVKLPDLPGKEICTDLTLNYVIAWMQKLQEISLSTQFHIVLPIGHVYAGKLIYTNMVIFLNEHFYGLKLHPNHATYFFRETPHGRLQAHPEWRVRAVRPPHDDLRMSRWRLWSNVRSLTRISKGGISGLVVIWGNSCSIGHEFESQQHILDGRFSLSFDVKIVLFV